MLDAANDPAGWIYVTNESRARPSFIVSEARVILVGHVHKPHLYSCDRTGRVMGHEVPQGHPVPLLRSRRWLGVVGSANWDFRSLYSNYETLLTAYDRDFAATLKRMMNEDLNASREVAWPAFKNRPIRHRYLENACGLLSPLL